MVNIIIRYDTNIQHVIHSFPSLLPLSQKCRINILLKITTYVLKSSLLLQKFSHSDGLRASKVWNQPSGFLKLRNWFDQYRSLQICSECRQFCHPAQFWKKPGKLWFAPFLKIWPVSQNIVHVDYEFYVLLYILTNMKTCGKVANTKSWIVMFSKKTPVYSGHWTIRIWVILRCWGNSSMVCQQNSDAL